MRLKAFALRNTKELIRDPLGLVFGIGLPVVLLLLISLINQSISQEVTISIFVIENFAPGIAVFSFSFISMFAGILISKDRCSSFLTRLFSSPLTPFEYIAGYSLPLVAVAAFQGLVCFVTAVFLGLPLTLELLPAFALLLLSAPLFIGFGILFGSAFADKQVGAMSSILVQVAALSSGMWFPLKEIGGALETVCNLLPFSHALNLVQGALANDYSALITDLLWLIGYTVAVFICAVLLFARKTKN